MTQEIINFEGFHYFIQRDEASIFISMPRSPLEDSREKIIERALRPRATVVFVTRKEPFTIRSARQTGLRIERGNPEKTFAQYPEEMAVLPKLMSDLLQENWPELRQTRPEEPVSEAV